MFHLINNNYRRSIENTAMKIACTHLMFFAFFVIFFACYIEYFVYLCKRNQ